MSSGHKKETKATDEQLAKVLNDPKVQKLLKRPYELNRDYDIPYLSGYSKDGRTIYMDRHLPETVKVNGKQLDPTPFLEEHEHVEKTLIDALGLPYSAKPGAHEYATAAEEQKVEAAGFNCKAYEKALEPYIKADETERIETAPPDLDMTPYKGDTKLETAIRGAQAAGQRP